MNPTVFIDGLALWCPALPGWDVAAAALARDDAMAADAADSAGTVQGPAGGTAAAVSPARRPAATVLAANERRRAPDSVLLALEVAQAAVLASGHDAHTLPSVFTSAHGDLPIVDALCRTLAGDPMLLSPTRFHHSVHNAASGYWAMASGSRAASTALAAYTHSFAAGLLEASSQALADATAVLLVAFDTEAVGPLASTNGSRGLLGGALVLSPVRGAASRWALTIALGPAGLGAAPPALRSAAAQALAANASADALPLFEALARGRPARLALPLGGQSLVLTLQPLGADATADAADDAAAAAEADQMQAAPAPGRPARPGDAPHPAGRASPAAARPSP
jgi:hypothetical protein